MYLSILKNNAQLCVHISKCAFTTSHLTCAKKLKNYRGPTMPWGWRYDGDEWRAKLVHPSPPPPQMHRIICQ